MSASKPLPIIYILDASNIVWRGQHGKTGYLTSPDKQRTGGVFLYWSTVRAILRQTKYVVATFDKYKRERLQRCKIYPQYKARNLVERTPKEVAERDQVKWQIDQTIALSEALGVRCVSSKQYEGDDLMATLAVRYEALGFDVRLITNDKDANQLVKRNIRTYGTDLRLMMDTEAVVKKYGVTPTKFVRWLALCGDATDGIPGCRGVGPTYVAELINPYKSLSSMIAACRADAKKPTKKQKLRTRPRNALLADVKGAQMSLKLAAAIKDIPPYNSWPAGRALVDVSKVDRAALHALYRQLGFNPKLWKMI